MYSTNNLKTLIDNHFKIIKDAIDEANKNSGVTAAPAGAPPPPPPPPAGAGAGAGAGADKPAKSAKSDKPAKPDNPITPHNLIGFQQAASKEEALHAHLKYALYGRFQKVNEPHLQGDQVEEYEWDEDDTDGKK
jgi:hypothetical protein